MKSRTPMHHENSGRATSGLSADSRGSFANFLNRGNENSPAREIVEHSPVCGLGLSGCAPVERCDYEFRPTKPEIGRNLRRQGVAVSEKSFGAVASNTFICVLSPSHRFA